MTWQRVEPKKVHVSWPLEPESKMCVCLYVCMRFLSPSIECAVSTPFLWNLVGWLFSLYYRELELHRLWIKSAQWGRRWRLCKLEIFLIFNPFVGEYDKAYSHPNLKFIYWIRNVMETDSIEWKLIHNFTHWNKNRTISFWKANFHYHHTLNKLRFFNGAVKDKNTPLNFLIFIHWTPFISTMVM